MKNNFLLILILIIFVSNSQKRIDQFKKDFVEIFSPKKIAGMKGITQYEDEYIRKMVSPTVADAAELIFDVFDRSEEERKEAKARIEECKRSNKKKRIISDNEEKNSKTSDEMEEKKEVLEENEDPSNPNNIAYEESKKKNINFQSRRTTTNLPKNCFYPAPIYWRPFSVLLEKNTSTYYCNGTSVSYINFLNQTSSAYKNFTNCSEVFTPNYYCLCNHNIKGDLCNAWRPAKCTIMILSPNSTCSTSSIPGKTTDAKVNLLYDTGCYNIYDENSVFNYSIGVNCSFTEDWVGDSIQSDAATLRNGTLKYYAYNFEKWMTWEEVTSQFTYWRYYNVSNEVVFTVLYESPDIPITLKYYSFSDIGSSFSSSIVGLFQKENAWILGDNISLSFNFSTVKKLITMNRFYLSGTMSFYQVKEVQDLGISFDFPLRFIQEVFVVDWNWVIAGPIIAIASIIAALIVLYLLIKKYKQRQLDKQMDG